MKWLKRTLIALALLLVVALALPFLISLEGYRPELEKAASERLGEPVTIAAIRLAALPTPHVSIEGIKAGSDAKLERITVTPQLTSLWQPVKVISDIELDGLTLTRQALTKLPSWAQPKSAEPPKVQVRIAALHLTDARLELGDATLGPLDGELTLDDTGAPQAATLATQDGKLKAEVGFGQQDYPLDIHAHDWTLPAGPALKFDALDIKGAATRSALKFTALDAKLYGGTVGGKVALDWSRGWQLDGALDIRALELHPLVALFSPNQHVSGRLMAHPTFSAAAPQADKLAAAIRLQTPFSVSNGVLHGVDIEQAATHLVKQGMSGGETRFDTLSGQLEMAQGGYRFTQLKVASGALAVDGAVDISARRELSGRITAQVGILGANASVPLNVSGTLDQPMLLPTGAALTGAAVGTALLGPGMGTAVGVKVGGWVENLFGGSKEKPTKK
ncbi:MAG: AsmA family protein [Gallionella sp.]|nr:AsmA family protein [Gallionella sp.]MDD4945644.1 AsmA family protein [Gallionella sp.]